MGSGDYSRLLGALLRRINVIHIEKKKKEKTVKKAT
jgi:hypothetical protein